MSENRLRIIQIILFIIYFVILIQYWYDYLAFTYENLQFLTKNNIPGLYIYDPIFSKLINILMMILVSLKSFLTNLVSNTKLSMDFLAFFFMILGVVFIPISMIYLLKNMNNQVKNY